MNSHDSYLLLWLEGPLQSWGYQSRFDRRSTLSYPTRSGILGLLAAALGIDRNDATGLRPLDTLRLTVYAYRNHGLTTDYHTVGAAYDPVSDRLSIPKTADGAVGTTVVTRREYLQDAAFGALLSGPAMLLRDLTQALVQPRWGLWLGRKCCLPSVPILQGAYATAEEASTRLTSLAAERRRLLQRVIYEVDDFEQGTDTLMDRPLDYGTRAFAPRRVAVSGPEGTS